MAWYVNAAYLEKKVSNSDWETDHSPGSTVLYSGIYRCMGCGREIAANARDPFPPQTHHQHPPASGSIRWRMIVWAHHEPK